MILVAHGVTRPPYATVVDGTIVWYPHAPPRQAQDAHVRGTGGPWDRRPVNPPVIASTLTMMLVVHGASSKRALVLVAGAQIGTTASQRTAKKRLQTW